MTSQKKQRKFSHKADWQAAHAELAANPEVFDSLKFDGLIVDVDGKPREQRRCPACFSTFSGPPISWQRAFVVLREQAQKFDSSLDLVAHAFKETPADQAATHLLPTPLI